MYIYALPNLRGYALPVRDDTAELSSEWSKSAASAQVVYGTWRLYTQPNYQGFMGDFRAHTDIMRLKPLHQLGSLECIMAEPPPPPPPPKY
ncbi:MAG TPA: beta/gamma crystallin-related protein [Stellaceae bacterium]|nr:beta/gamma crystallin-related protein [Stellaceae bacterium]